MPPKKKTRRTKAEQPKDEREAFLEELDSVTPEDGELMHHPQSEETDEDPNEDKAEEEADAVEEDIPVKKVAVTGKAKKKSPEELNAGPILKEVWEEDGKRQDESVFDRPKRRFPWGWIVGVVVTLAVVTVAGFWFFSRGEKFEERNVRLALTSETQVASGDTVELTVTYSNTTPIDIKDVQLSVEYPEGFTFTEASINPKNDAKNAFSLGLVRAGVVGEVVIRGKVLGSVGSVLTYRTQMLYQPANFSSKFSTRGEATMEITSSVVTLALDGPKEAIAKTEREWTIAYANTSDSSIDRLRIVVEAPTGFTLVSATPSPSTGLRWDVTGLKGKASGKITFRGKIDAAPGDSVEFSAVASLVKPGDILEDQTTATLLLSFVDPGLELNVAVNGQSDKPTLTPGELATVSLQIKNSSDAQLDDVALAVQVGGVGDLSKAANPLKATVSGSTITWTKKHLSGLGSMKPGDVVSLTLSLPTKVPPVVTKDSERNPALAIRASLTSASVPSGTTLPVVTIVAKVKTTIALTADGRYYTDDLLAVGSGPVPPKVGQATTYRIFWTLTSTTSDLKSTTVSAVLPPQATWANTNVTSSAGTVIFDPVTRLVTWSMDTMLAGTGSRFPAAMASFDVSITPTPDLVGSVVDLLNASTASSTDAWSLSSLSASAGVVTTNVPNDPQAAGEGQVAE